MLSPLSHPLDRRRFLGLAGLGVAATALTACAGPSTSGAVPGAAASSSSSVDWASVKPAATIQFWSSNPGSSQQVTQQIVDAYNASQSATKVTLVTAGASYEDIAAKFQTAQASGQLPDLMVLSDVWWFRYFLQGSITPLNDLLEAAEVQTSDYRKTFLDDYSYAGSTWAVPWARSTPLFYYNKDHWKAAGLPDRAPATWQELAEWAPKLQAAGLGTQHAYQLPAVAGYAGWTLQNNLWGWGTGWSQKDSFTITCDSSAAQQALQFLQDAVYKDRWAGVASTSAITDLTAKAVSATTSSTGDLRTALKAGTIDLGVGFLPGGPAATEPVCPTGGAGLAIPSGIDPGRQLAAMQFIKFLTSPENTVTFSDATGYIPVRTSADTTQLLTTTPQLKTAIDQLSLTRPQDWARVFLPGADQEMGKTAAAVFTGQADVASSLSQLKTTLEGIYTRDVEPKLKK